MRDLRILLVVVTILGASGCDDAGMSSTGPGRQLDLSGTFSSTTVADSAGYNSLRWVLSQAGNEVTGTIAITGNGQLGAGTVRGTLEGRTLTFTMSVPAGGFAPGLPSCSASLAGAASNVTSDIISGTYSGTNTCIANPISGTFVLRRE